MLFYIILGSQVRTETWPYKRLSPQPAGKELAGFFIMEGFRYENQFTKIYEHLFFRCVDVHYSAAIWRK